MPAPPDTFLGFPRADGRVGVRNHVVVLCASGLMVPAARRIGSLVRGAITVTAPYGGLLGADRAIYERAQQGWAVHPNAGAVLLVGDDPPRLDALAKHCAAHGQRVEALAFDDCGNDIVTLVERGVRLGAVLSRELSRQQRERVPLGRLFLGLECGRSDPSSGLVSNPLLGRMADRLVDAGGAAVIGETTEWLGAEHLLAQRAVSPEVAEAILAAVRDHEQAAVDAGLDLLGNNPGPINIKAGLSSIEEKSLGNIAKSGSRPIQGVLNYAEAPPQPGLYVMHAPAYAPESLTGFSTAGAQLMLFTTGQGNAYASALSPTLKVSANPETCARLQHQLDFDASAVFRGEEDLDRATDRLQAEVAAIASGASTWGEVLLEGDEIISRFGRSI